jgi:hypothetical protein
MLLLTETIPILQRYQISKTEKEDKLWKKRRTDRETEFALYRFVMELLTLAAYPIVFVHGKLHPYSKSKARVPLAGRPLNRNDLNTSADRISPNEAAEKYFVGNARALKKLEIVENSLRENAKIVITEHGSLPVNVSSATGNGKGVRVGKEE